MVTGREAVKNIVLVIGYIVGYKQLNAYYYNIQIIKNKTNKKTAVHQYFVCLFLWVEGWYLLPEVSLFEQCCQVFEKNNT